MCLLIGDYTWIISTHKVTVGQARQIRVATSRLIEPRYQRVLDIWDLPHEVLRYPCLAVRGCVFESDEKCELQGLEKIEEHWRSAESIGAVHCSHCDPVRRAWVEILNSNQGISGLEHSHWICLWKKMKTESMLLPKAFFISLIKFLAWSNVLSSST